MYNRTLNRRDSGGSSDRLSDYMKNPECSYIPNHFRHLPLDIIDEDSAFIIKANLPGLTKKDIKISMLDNELTLQTERAEEKKEENVSVLCERYKGNFKRVLMLNESCDVEKIKANYEDGVLSLAIPKKQPKPMKSIVIE